MGDGGLKEFHFIPNFALFVEVDGIALEVEETSYPSFILTKKRTSNPFMINYNSNCL